MVRVPRGRPALETKAKSQKVANLRRNPQITCLIEDGDKYEELRGVEMVGHAEIVEDPDRIFELGISVFERTSGQTYTEEMKPFVEVMLNKRVVVKIHVDKYVSWDHRKLGMPGSRRAAEAAGSARRPTRRSASGTARRRVADPRLERQIHAALGDASTIVNVGAGAGSYEPGDRTVVALEPSA